MLLSPADGSGEVVGRSAGVLPPKLFTVLSVKVERRESVDFPVRTDPTDVDG
jgi:hypothetical protein